MIFDHKMDLKGEYGNDGEFLPWDLQEAHWVAQLCTTNKASEPAGPNICQIVNSLTHKMSPISL